MLMQIPGVSVQSANVIMKQLSTIKNLIESLEKNPQVLDSIVTITKTGKREKIK